MPCYLFTYHGYGTWLPDHQRGYVRRKEGVLRTDAHMADCYRKNLSTEALFFDSGNQRLLIETTRATHPFLNVRFHGIVCEASHMHVLLSWNSAQSSQQISRSIKTRLTRELNQKVERRIWLSKGSSRKQVRDRRHFEYLMQFYLPKHGGLKWSEGGGFYG